MVGGHEKQSDSSTTATSSSALASAVSGDCDIAPPLQNVRVLLSLIPGVTNAIDVQVANTKGDLEQEIVIISQLHVINVQQLCDLDRLALRWNTTDIHSICQEECKSILIEVVMMQRWEHLLLMVVFH
jgi:hypothetical protein